jgi:hypothetical protein
VPLREWLEFEGDVISSLFAQTESALARRWRSRHENGITKVTEEAAKGTLFLGDDWFNPLEVGERARIRGFIEELLEVELDTALGRDMYQRPWLVETGVGDRPVMGAGHRYGHRERQLIGTFGPGTARVPRARMDRSDSKTVE